MASASLHDHDIVAWADEQAREVRELGRRPGLSNLLDWDNLAEEIESVGKSQLTAVRSHLRRVLIHLIKVLSDPDAPSRAHWRGEINAIQRTAASAFTNAMRPKIDLDRLWVTALRDADDALIPYDRRVSAALPQTCPLTLDDLIDEDFAVDAVLARLAQRETDGSSD